LTSQLVLFVEKLLRITLAASIQRAWQVLSEIDNFFHMTLAASADVFK